MAASFTLFPELPFELRLKIWQFSVPGPRILGVGHEIQYKSFYGRLLPSTIEWRTSDPIPSLLHVCHESRKEALKLYQRSLGVPLKQGKNYIDFGNDTIYFGGPGRGFSDLDVLLQASFNRPGNYLLDMFLGADYGVRDAEKIQRMIVDIDEDRYGRRLFIWDEIRLFTSLRELTILVWEEDSEADRLMALYQRTLSETVRKHPEWSIPEIVVIAMHTKKVWGSVKASTVSED
ncbi:uncharacterized protein LY89DRAFT_307337 [Mollisia scopiformis]|uniref:2EXR domain-containing protein n=1 Tax=Mollisia scopiformis TaxID=149040 RepID=A0A194XSG5_MOLSC|nr:uncharacterized protein LY89DRAFT_307337 [Mollisia scopiformis]KUJ22672.1 hypothetical protein LY89DRAFT_307337 [Mollisia scopiformis]